MPQTDQAITTRSKHFVIIFEGRTGSSYVVSCLNSHPDILCYPEILANSTETKQKKTLNTFARNQSLAPNNLISLRDAYFHCKNTKQHPVQVSGFKTKLHQLKNLPSFYRFIHKHQFKLIYLKRKNLLKSIISELNAIRLKKKHGIYNAENTNQIQGSIYIDPEKFITHLQQRLLSETAHETFFNACQLSKHIFYYEDMIKSELLFFQELLFYLNVEPISLQGKFHKNTPDNISDAIANYDEIRTLIKGTLFEQYLVDN